MPIKEKLHIITYLKVPTVCNVLLKNKAKRLLPIARLGYCRLNLKGYFNPILSGLWNYVTERGGALWPGWILAILRLSVGILKPKNDFHQTFLIFGCP